jgi:hypothetical protein
VPPGGLNQVIDYILKMRHLKDMKKRLRSDFKSLVQQIESNLGIPKFKNYIEDLDVKYDNVMKLQE